MIIAQTFDTNLAEYLAILTGKFPDEDVSAGSPALRHAQSIAMAKTGLERKIEFQHKQNFYATANATNLAIKAADDGFEGQLATEELEDFRKRLRSLKKSPPAGGTEDDYIREAEKQAGVETASIIPPDIEGPGKIGVILLSAMPEGQNDSVAANELQDSTASFVAGMVDAYVKNLDTGVWAKIDSVPAAGRLVLDADIFPVAGGAEVDYRVQYRSPGSSIVDATQTAIDDFKPIDATANVRAAEVSLVQNISMILSGSGANIPNTILAIENYVNSLAGGGTLSVAVLISLAVNNGAIGVIVNNPTSDQNSSLSGVILLGSISVT